MMRASMNTENEGARASTVQERPTVSRPNRTTFLGRLKRRVIGAPLETERLVHERLGKPTALAVFASDNLSSSAYATEEILRVLLYSGMVGAAAFAKVVPITAALLVVLGILLFSYRQTIKAYPKGGGSYIVTRDNFGLATAQVAGVALLTDYILTVSVSVSAGTAALTSLVHPLFPFRVIIAVGFIALIAMGNLRGLREAGRVFAVPTYFFILMIGVLIAYGFARLLFGHLPAQGSQFPVPPALHALSFFLVLKAFASGGAAVTGVEAISDGVPAFKPPEWKNARTTLMWMGGILAVMFSGISVLAAHLKIVPDPHEKVTVLAQLGRAIFGNHGAGTVLFAMLQIATMLILVLAANTSFADFPRLASFIAADRFLPRQLTRYGDRLVFSNGILVLSGFSTVLVIVFKGSVTALIPLYAVGVFTSFTLSQAAMVVRHRKVREPGWRGGAIINGFGSFVSGVVAIIIAKEKFLDGAWVILVAIPLILSGLFTIHRHYQRVSVTLRDPKRRPPRDTPRQMVIIAAGERGREDHYAAAYAARVFPTEVRIVHVEQGDEVNWSTLEEWSRLGDRVEIVPGSGDLPDDLRTYVRNVRSELGANDIINVIVPETVATEGLSHILRSREVQRIKAELLAEAGVVVTNVTYHEGYEDLEPGEEEGGFRAVREEWRHVAVVLVSGVHNATLSGLRFARSLRADELHCVHVAVEEQEAERVIREWDEAQTGSDLIVLPSPYRQVARPIHGWIRDILQQHPKTFVTIVIPEFIVQKRWHNILHNQTPLMLKGLFLFEPSVVVSAVPYALGDPVSNIQR
jgi:amino acid transporter